MRKIEERERRECIEPRRGERMKDSEDKNRKE